MNKYQKYKGTIRKKSIVFFIISVLNYPPNLSFKQKTGYYQFN